MADDFVKCSDVSSSALTELVRFAPPAIRDDEDVQDRLTEFVLMRLSHDPDVLSVIQFLNFSILRLNHVRSLIDAVPKQVATLGLANVRTVVDLMAGLGHAVEDLKAEVTAACLPDRNAASEFRGTTVGTERQRCRQKSSDG
jgi:hypothetical protein